VSRDVNTSSTIRCLCIGLAQNNSAISLCAL
jgi:hypothetical protein